MATLFYMFSILIKFLNYLWQRRQCRKSINTYIYHREKTTRYFLQFQEKFDLRQNNLEELHWFHIYYMLVIYDAFLFSGNDSEKRYLMISTKFTGDNSLRVEIKSSFFQNFKLSLSIMKLETSALADS